MEKITIGVVILTLNEEINLEKCINSVKWANEIVVLDSGSIDDTIKIAKLNNARTYLNIQKPTFKISEQRNYALKNCQLTSEWILFLDADETVPDSLYNDIILSIANNNYNAYSLTPKYLFWGKWLKRTQGFPNWHDRLLKHENIYFSGGVWEHFTGDFNRGYIRTPYNHYANSKGFFDWLDRHKRYSNWDAQTTMAFLESKDATSLNTTRKLRLRSIATKFWYLRPWFRFFHMYILRGGFLEGWKSFIFCLHYFIYEMMVVIQIIELKRIKENKDL